MAEVRDRNLPHQVQVHPQYRFDNTTGGGYGAKNYHSGPSTSQVLAVLTLLPIGGTLLALAGLTLAGTVIGLMLATPLFIIFSPVLVPAAIAIAMAVTGFLSSGAFGLTGLSSLSYVLNRLRYATGTEQLDLDHAKRRVQDMADGPSTSQVLAVLTLLPIGGTLLALAGLTLAGTVIGLMLATPLFIIFSPVLVPAAIAIAMAVTGFLSSGAFGLTGLSSLSYVLNRLRYATGTEQLDLDHAKRRVQDMAEYVGQKTKEVGQKIENKAHEGQVGRT
ncbi:hypothetical protein GOBAR_AA00499 [Gossypium barbadense]|uniref:Oleosin n=3 Tax=Gossypium TaxID=3633 RepID=A0A2P5YX32_GOSBA|nr:hypothetical protein GOBAR_AA00499 [Gossypium barbadense]